VSSPGARPLRPPQGRRDRHAAAQRNLFGWFPGCLHQYLNPASTTTKPSPSGSRPSRHAPRPLAALRPWLMESQSSGPPALDRSPEGNDPSVHISGGAMQQVEVQLEDDLTGGPADETVQFGLDGRTFEIDLNKRHAAEFRQRLAPFVQRARPVRPRRSRAMARTAASRERSREIRAWAEQHGFVVAQHGRLPQDVIEQYDRALIGEQPPERRGRQRSAGLRSAPHDASSKPHRSARRSQKHRARRAD
jgi:hypothetical protein